MSTCPSILLHSLGAYNRSRWGPDLVLYSCHWNISCPRLRHHKTVWKLLGMNFTMLICVACLLRLSYCLVSQAVWSDDHSASSSACFVHVTSTCCYVMMTSFGRYALIGQPSHHVTPPITPPDTCKRLRLAVFVPRIAASLDYSVRVYFVEDTASALQVSLFPF